MNNGSRGFYFIFIFFFTFPAFCYPDEELSLDLEPIVVSYSEAHLFKELSLPVDKISVSPFNCALSLSGIDLQSRSPAGDIQTDFSLRGSTFQGVLILLDGRRINDPQTGHHNSDIPLTKEDVEVIRVIPGAGSSLFGPDAIGGAINFLRKKPQEDKTVLGASIGRYQSRSGILSLSRKLSDLGLRLSLERKDSAGFYEDTDFKNLTATFSSAWELPGADYNLNFGYQDKEFGAYDFYTPGMGYLSKEWTETLLLDTDLNIRRDRFSFRPSFLWRRHYDKFALDKTLSRSTYLNHHRTDLYTPAVYFELTDFAFNRFGLGLEYSQEEINSTNLGARQRSRKSIFIDGNKDMAPRVSLGFSWRGDDYDGFGFVHTGSTALKFRLRQWDSISLGFSKSLRAPSFTELYYSDPITLGNPNLAQEQAFNYQLGYDYKREGLSYGVTSYLRREDDFIDWVKRARSDAKWQVSNITSASVSGAEVYFNIPLKQYLEFGLNYAYVNKRIKDQGYFYKYGPNYLRHLINGVFNFDLPFGRQKLALAYKKKSRRDGWVILNSYFSYNLNKNSQVFFNLSNVFNVEYQEIEGIPQPGRSFESGLRLEW